MEQLVIPSALEQEYLLHALEAAVPVRAPRQFFLWTQGQLQALLPHRVLVCLQLGADDAVLHLSCLHSDMLDAALRRRLTDPADGLAPRLARHCRAGAALPARYDCATPTPCAALAGFHADLQASGLDNVLLHGSGPLAGGACFFVLFGLPPGRPARPAYFLELLLPCLHLCWQRVTADGAGGTDGAALARPFSRREREILHWVREGKSNDEIGQILGISGLTVKNHLQRLYRLLGVSNRTHAIARCAALRLDHPALALVRAA